MYVQVDARGADVTPALQSIPGVKLVTPSDTRGQLTGFEVHSETGHDVRREIASAVVSQGWGLLELRPLRMSLEEIFLRLTTEEADTPAATDASPTGEETTPVQEATHE
jgi:ABC-2 type transport system ATP-binding protein